jgi:hypothetical protein
LGIVPGLVHVSIVLFAAEISLTHLASALLPLGCQVGPDP